MVSHNDQQQRCQPALPSSHSAMIVAEQHAVNGHTVHLVPHGMTIAMVAMGCFWGAERLFWQQPGVYSTSVGYSGGVTPNPTYREVCSGQTGHAEVVRIVFNPAIISYRQLLKLFWEQHDPAQGMRQGGDIGTQYRSAIYTLTAEQTQQALSSREQFQQAMATAGDMRMITTEIVPAQLFYFAEDEHQQYLAKHPQGYCSLGGIGICLPAEG